jgi:hypothetical protein
MFFNSTNIIIKFSYCSYFLFFINKKTNLRVQKWPNIATPIFFFFIKIKKIKNKKLGAIWEVLDIIGQIEKIWNFRGWIAKIETLVFELKNTVNFGEENCNFP